MERKKTRGAQNSARKAANKRRHKRRLRKYTLYYLLLIIIGVAAGVAMSLTVFFKINSVSVQGGTRYRSDDILTVAGIEIGTNLFMADTENARADILSSFPYIEQARVRRMFPDSIIIELTEATPYAALRGPGGYMLITEEGRVLDTDLSELPYGFVQVIGMEPGYLLPGEHLPSSCDEQLVMLRYLKEALGEVPFGGLDLIDLSDRLNIRMLYERRVVLSLGSESDLSRKLSYAKAILNTKTGDNFTGVLSAAEALPTLRYRDIFSAEVWPFGDEMRALYAPEDEIDEIGDTLAENDAAEDETAASPAEGQPSTKEQS